MSEWASNESFVAAWQTSRTASEVARMLNVRRDTVAQRASRLRRKGVRLKRMGHGPLAFDLEALNKLADAIASR
jgi:hypothetical protein